MLPAALTAFLITGLLLAGPPAQAEPAAASTFTPVSPTRVLDTRSGSPVGAGRVVTLDLAARVPATTTAVVLNVTGVSPTSATHVTVFPAGGAVPAVSNLNLVAGDVRANQVTVRVADRKVSLRNNSGSVHLVADLAGYYATGAGAKFTPLRPARALDTRTGDSPLGPGGTRVVDLTGRIPASATAVTFNLTATGGTAATFVTAWPAGAPRPLASNLNVAAGDTRPNQVTVAVTDRKVSLYNNAGTSHLLLDLAGFYTPEYGASFVPLSPKRVLDSRDGTGTGGSTDPIGAEPLSLDLAGELPPTSTGVLLNVTAVEPTAPGYVTAWSYYHLPETASTLNVSPGQTVANAAAVAFVIRPTVDFVNTAGRVHLVADLAGAFAVVEPACVDDCVYAWGANQRRNLGTAEPVDRSSTPTRVVGLSGVRAVAGNGTNGYALRTDGTVWAWGDNFNGSLGNGWTVRTDYGGSATPVPVVGLTDVTAITVPGYALRADGTVWAWGANNTGQLGNGTTTASAVPVRVSGLTGVVAIAGSGSTGYALRADGTVWAWGYGYGALGDGTYTEYSSVPVEVSGLTGVTAIASGDRGAYALRTDGTVWAWGDNRNGQLGTGQDCVPAEPCVALTPVRVAGLTEVTALAGGWFNGYAVRADGTVWSWGVNYDGQLGDGRPCPPAGTCESRVPVRVSTIADATRVASFDHGGYALRADGTVWAWGSDTFESLGNDSVTSGSRVPVPVQGLSGVTAISGGSDSGFALVPRP